MTAIKNCTYRKREIHIGSRFFLAPINTGFAIHGSPTDSLINFHDERSGKHIGVAYVGNVAIGSSYTTNPGKKWSQLCEVIAKNGSVPGIQLACRNSKVPAQTGWLNRNKHKFIHERREETVAMTVSELRHLIDDFVYSSIAASDLGFKVIQIHAAHGYLLSQFLNREINKRTDEYSLTECQVIRDIVEGIRSKLPSAFIDIRMSIRDSVEDPASEIAYKTELIDRIVGFGVDCISISNGMYDLDKRLIYPPEDWGHAVYLDDVKQLASNYSGVIWNVVGNIWDLRLIPEDVTDNLTFGLGRALIADPLFVQKSLLGDYGSILPCGRNNLCHYYSRGVPHIECPVNQTLAPQRRTNL